jgi:hypothetical protein
MPRDPKTLVVNPAGQVSPSRIRISPDVFEIQTMYPDHTVLFGETCAADARPTDPSTSAPIVAKGTRRLIKLFVINVPIFF